MRFLVVDDDFEACLLMRKILQPFGSVEAATDGEKCVEIFHSSIKNNKPFDLITLDILMPHLDGHETLREIRQIEREEGISPTKQTHIIMVSGLENSKEVNDAYSLGMATGYIEKPIDKTALLDEISKLGITLREAKAVT